MKKGRKKVAMLLLSLLMMLQWMCGMPNSVYAFYDSDLSAIGANAESIQEWNHFRYVVTENEVSIVGYSESINGVLEIPSEIDGFPVTRIEKDAFYDQEELVEVMIPITVIEISSTAFHSCYNLQTFTVDVGNPVYCVKNGLLLDKSEHVLIRCPNGWYGEVNEIPETVFLIADSAFEDCISLTSVTLPQSVTSIGKLAFSNCTSLNSIYFPDGLQKIGDGAFHSCIALQNIQLPSSLQQMGIMAFADCQAISEVTIPALSGTLSYSAFSGCFALQRVVIAEGITTLTPEVFSGCTALQEIQLPSTLETIQEKAFQNCCSLQQIVIPASVSSLSAYSFFGCTSLSSIYVAEDNPYYTVLDGVLLCSNLEELVFCPPALSLTDYRIPESVTIIDDYAFQNNLQIQSIIIPETVQELKSAFCYNADNLKAVQIEADADIPEYAFQSCDQLANVTLKNGISTVGTGAFLDCVSLYSVEIPETVTTIGPHAFGYQSDVGSQTDLVVLPYFSILCYADTAAKQYAEENGFSVQILSPICTSTTTETMLSIETTTSNLWEGTTTSENESFTTSVPIETTISVTSRELTPTTTTTEAVYTSQSTTGTTEEKTSTTTVNATKTTTTTTTTIAAMTTEMPSITLPTTIPIVTTTEDATTATTMTVTIITSTTAIATVTATSNTSTMSITSTTSTTEITTFTTMTTIVGTTTTTYPMEVVSLGDVDANGSISVEDAILVLTYYAKRSANLPVYLFSESDAAAEQAAVQRADVNGDGWIMVEDAVWILEQYAKQSVGLL